MNAAGAAPSQAVRRLTEVMRETSIDASGVARILDRDPKTVQRWLRQETAPRWEIREIVLALNVVLERIAEVIDPAAAEDWLFTPVPSIGYERPVDLIRAGRAREVLNLIDALGEGVFAWTEARETSARSSTLSNGRRSSRSSIDTSRRSMRR
jgi:uncharacterized protein (DUF2384 family)